MMPVDEAALLRESDKSLNRLVFSFRSLGIPAEDLKQEVSIAALRAIRAWRPDGGASVTTLIFQSALNHLIRLRRSRGFRKRRAVAVLSLDAPLPGRDEPMHASFGTWGDQVRQTDLRDLSRLIGKLPTVHQQVVLGQLAEETCRSLAKEMGVSKSQIDRLHSEAITRMSRMCRDRSQTRQRPAHQAARAANEEVWVCAR